jgi:hypothetical protein
MVKSQAMGSAVRKKPDFVSANLIRIEEEFQNDLDTFVMPNNRLDEKALSAMLREIRLNTAGDEVGENRLYFSLYKCILDTNAISLCYMLHF